MSLTRRLSATLAALAVCLLCRSAVAQRGAAADADEFDRTPQDCISVTSIDRTKVIDDETILFFMRGRQVLRNHLPRTCPGLARHDRFSYRTTANRLCDIDTITVLEQWGGRLQNGFTCPLGEFHPITAEEVEELEGIAAGRGRGRDAIDSEPAQLPRGEKPEEAEQGDEND